MRSTILKTLAMTSVSLFAVAGPALAGGAVGKASQTPPIQVAAASKPDLAIPTMDPVHGKKLFASKGCVVCHSINGVGGTDAPNLDASTMQHRMNPFDFFARMWRGAEPMIAMQNNELGHQIEFTGQDLADIVAFAHDAAVQKTFTEADIPADIKAHMDEGEDSGTQEKAKPGDMDSGTRGTMGSGQGMGQGMGSGGMMGSGSGSGMMGNSRMGR